MSPPRLLALPLGIAFLAIAPGASAGIKLKAIEFPAAATGTKGPETPPGAAPLSQRVVFVFNKKPKLGPAVADGLRIRVSAQNVDGQTAGEPALGTYEVDGKRVIFTPRLPTGSIENLSPTSDLSADATLPGLLPGTVYEITVDEENEDAVTNLSKVAPGLPTLLSFTTVGMVPPAAALETYFANFDDDAPALKKKKGVLPKPGLKGLHPNVFADPAGLFSSIPADERPPFVLRFQAPLAPQPEALAAAFRLRATMDPQGMPLDVDLPITPVLTANALDGAEVLVFPSGVLPVGHALALEISDALESIEGITNGGGAPATFDAIAQYTVANGPNGGEALLTAFEETFDTQALQDESVVLEGKMLAAWDEGDSGHLLATSAFSGDAPLGRFQAPPFDTLILIDTDFQTFPLLNGATPDAKPGTVVTNGVFHFSSFHLPEGVTLRAVGSNPLVISCTEDCLIEGRILVSGSDGASVVTFDSALLPIPGGAAGAGGGRGGDGHPVLPAPPGTSLLGVRTPLFGGSGQGPGGVGLGGGGGQNGCTLPWTPFDAANCSAFAAIGDGSRGAGGGGGSFATFLPLAPEPALPVSGRGGAIGAGDHLPVPFDPLAPIPPAPLAYQAEPGNPENAVAMPNPNLTFAEAVTNGLVFDSGTPFLLTTDWAMSRRVTLPGAAGPAVFLDEDPDNDFIGPGGELAAIQGGQGGGAGASRTEGLSRECALTLGTAGLPPTVLDAPGGGGGGGAGAVLIRAIGTIELRGAGARIEARGGNGGGGEMVETSSRGGAGAGGSGGAVVLQSATNVLLDDPSLPALTIDVSGGCYANAINLSNNTSSGTPGADNGVLQFGDGGTGGPGLVQVHVPPGAPDRVDEGRVGAVVYPSVFQLGTAVLGCQPSGQMTIPALVDPAKTPANLSSVSVARSVWIDLGAVTSDFRPPIVTSAGPIAGPLFGIPGIGPLFAGTDPQTGYVPKDAAGKVALAATAHVEVDAPDLLKTDFLPNGPTYFQSVQVVFQGADEDAAIPGTPDQGTETAWVTDATLLNGRKFLRWEIRIDMAENSAVPLDLFTPRPQIGRLRIPFRF